MYLAVRGNQQNIVVMVMCLNTLETTAKFLGIYSMRIDQKSSHSLGQKGTLRQHCGIIKTCVAPGDHLVHLEMCDGGELFFNLLPSGIFFCVVEPYTTGQQRQKRCHHCSHHPDRKWISLYMHQWFSVGLYHGVLHYYRTPRSALLFKPNALFLS